jgi:hypothetical protein
MNFLRELSLLAEAFEEKNIRYALIGGLALSMRGVQRATLDIDFLLLSEDLPQAHAMLVDLGFERHFYSENVSHYLSIRAPRVRLDILHAFRHVSLSMIARADFLPWPTGICVPVATIEDLIGLKVQAFCNDPERFPHDWSDILLLTQYAQQNQLRLNWKLIQEFFEIFEILDKFQDLKRQYGPVDGTGKE